jgi:hypothetical protein
MGGVNHLFTLLERQIHLDNGIRRQAMDFGHGLMTEYFTGSSPIRSAWNVK